MRQPQIYILFILISIGLFTSCKNSHEYKIDPAFADYLQKFKDEAAARGKKFNPESTGLIMEFGTLSDGTAGLTHYETPIRIQFDKTYWDDISKSTGADLMKEDLVFHELGHGLLGRGHLNSTLSNDDWKSIMCGGTKVDNRPWNINYRGVRRSYYLDELFDITTSEPSFASMTFRLDTTGFTTDISRNFDTPTQTIWKDTVDNQHVISNSGGRMRFESKVSSAYLVLVRLPSAVSISSSFSYELTFQYSSGDASNQYGLIFGPVATGSTGTSDPIEYFTINNNQKMQMGNRTWYSFYTELGVPSTRTTGVNKLKVFKFGTMLYYFVNDVYCYSTEILASANLNQFGFMAPPMSSIWIDNFKISHKGALLAPMKVKQNQLLENYIQKVDNFIPNNVRNQ